MPSDMSARRPAALSRGPATNPRSLALRALDVAPGDGEERGDARMRAPVAHPREPLLDEDAVDVVEANDVGDGAERDEIEQCGEVRPAATRRTSPMPRSRARSAQQHVEHHADAGDVLATGSRIRAGSD